MLGGAWALASETPETCSALTCEHLGEDGVDRRRVADFDIARERSGADRDSDRHLGRVGGQARDVFGQTVEHVDGGVMGDGGALLQHRWRQRGERGGVGRGVQFRVNLRRPAIVDRRPAAEHQHRRDQRVHHRDIAAAVAKQASRTECLHGKSPQLSRFAKSVDRAPRVITGAIKQPAGLCISNGSRTICPNAKVFAYRGPRFFRPSQGVKPFFASGGGNSLTIGSAGARRLPHPRAPPLRSRKSQGFHGFPGLEERAAPARRLRERLPKPPNSCNVALRDAARRSGLCYSGSNVYERRLRGCYGTRSDFQLGAQSERLLDDVVAAAVFRTGESARRPDDRAAAARVGAAQRMARDSLPAEGLRRAVLDSARRPSYRLQFTWPRI